MDELLRLWARFLVVIQQVWDFFLLFLRSTVGKVVEMYNLPFWSLPLLEQLIYIIVTPLIVYLLFIPVWRLWGKFMAIFHSVINFVTAIFFEMPHLLIILLLAIAAAWVITTFNLDVGLPNLQTLWKQLRG